MAEPLRTGKPLPTQVSKPNLVVLGQYVGSSTQITRTTGFQLSRSFMITKSEWLDREPITQ